MIPKEESSSNISQFQPISLLNVKDKIFFRCHSPKVNHLERNRLVDTAVQKAGILGFSGCLEHTSIIWHQIQAAKRGGGGGGGGRKEKKEKERDLHVISLI